MTKRAMAIAVWGVGMAPALAMAVPEQLCVGQTALPGPDGRVLGHLPYEQVRSTDLVAAPPGFGLGQACMVHRDAAPDLTRMLRAAAMVPAISGSLRAISCYRSIPHQRQVFCGGIGPGRPCRDAAERARSVGPPGYSEHATGYAIDFAVRPSPGCPDVEACMALTPAGQWLLAHATEYGFELSFPPGNPQRVTWEPWHWRWVGRTTTEPGAANARTLFATARAQYPARPGIAEIVRLPPELLAPAPRITLPNPPIVIGKKDGRRRK